MNLTPRIRFRNRVGGLLRMEIQRSKGLIAWAGAAGVWIVGRPEKDETTGALKNTGFSLPTETKSVWPPCMEVEELTPPFEDQIGATIQRGQGRNRDIFPDKHKPPRLSVEKLGAQTVEHDVAEEQKSVILHTQSCEETTNLGNSRLSRSSPKTPSETAKPVSSLGTNRHSKRMRCRQRNHSDLALSRTQTWEIGENSLYCSEGGNWS